MSRKKTNPLLRLALDFGPLLAFFLANARWGIMNGTAVFMVAVTISIAVGFALERKVAPLPLLTMIMVLFFGGLTLFFDDELFIKMKPTIINGFVASILFVGLFFGKPLLQPLMGAALPPMDDRGWRILTLRWACYFVFLALVNETIWRNFSTDFWVTFKVFGNLPMTIVFALAQLPLLRRHHRAES